MVGISGKRGGVGGNKEQNKNDLIKLGNKIADFNIFTR